MKGDMQWEPYPYRFISSQLLPSHLALSQMSSFLVFPVVLGVSAVSAVSEDAPIWDGLIWDGTIPSRFYHVGVNVKSCTGRPSSNKIFQRKKVHNKVRFEPVPADPLTVKTTNSWKDRHTLLETRSFFEVVAVSPCSK